MSAAFTQDDVAVDRRTLLRVGLLGGALMAVTAAADTSAITSVVERLATDRSAPSAGPSTPSRASLPSAAMWESLVGESVELRGDGFRGSSARVLDVRDVAHASPNVTQRGEAYSVLLDAPSLPDEPSVLVTIRDARLGSPTLVLTPVNGDGSWEAVVDRRTIVGTH